MASSPPSAPRRTAGTKGKKSGSGTGLGLPSALAFAGLTGGTLRLESGPTMGTIVILWLAEAGDAAVVQGSLVAGPAEDQRQSGEG